MEVKEMETLFADAIVHPECYTPNDDPYPLCKGNADQLHECRECCLYEDMDERAYDE